MSIPLFCSAESPEQLEGVVRDAGFANLEELLDAFELSSLEGTNFDRLREVLLVAARNKLKALEENRRAKDGEAGKEGKCVIQ